MGAVEEESGRVRWCSRGAGEGDEVEWRDVRDIDEVELEAILI
jgi:hypothetical protein